MCSEYVLGQHRCYIRAQSVSDKPFKNIHFDFECMQDKIISCKEGYTPSVCQNCKRDVCGTISQDGQTMNCDKGYNPHCTKCETPYCGNYGHTPNLVISHSTCTECMEVEVTRKNKCIHCGPRCVECEKCDTPCDTCGFREVMFSGPETANDFCAWLFTEQHKNAVVIAHNMEVYNGVFLLNYLLKNHKMVPNVIYTGSKIMSIHVANQLNIKVIDSFNHLPLNLSKLPHAFGLTELRKGYFPHLFNRVQN